MKAPSVPQMGAGRNPSLRPGPALSGSLCLLSLWGLLGFQPSRWSGYQSTAREEITLYPETRSVQSRLFSSHWDPVPPPPSISSLISRGACFTTETRRQRPPVCAASSRWPWWPAPAPRLAPTHSGGPRAAAHGDGIWAGLGLARPGWRELQLSPMRTSRPNQSKVATVLREITIRWVSLTLQVRERKHSGGEEEQRRKGEGRWAWMRGFGGRSAQPRPAAVPPCLRHLVSPPPCFLVSGNL